MSDNPAWWLSKASIARDAIALGAADAGLNLQDLSVTVTGGIESAPDYTVAALNTDSGTESATNGTGVDVGGFGAYQDDILTSLQ